MSNLELPPTALAHIQIDGSCPANPGPMGVGYLIETDGAGVLVRAGQQIGRGTNNQAEYRALIYALRHALRLGIYSADVESDSLLLVNQINGTWKVRDRKSLGQLYEEAISLAGLFRDFTLHHIPREYNTRADELSRTLAMEAVGLPKPKDPRRHLLPFQAAALRVWYNMGEQNMYRLGRIVGLSNNQVDQVVHNRSYAGATFEGIPDWNVNPTHPALLSYSDNARRLYGDALESGEDLDPILTIQTP